MAFSAYFFYNAVIDLVDLSDLLTCFFYFCSTNNLFLCLSFIVCNVLPTCVLWRLHIPHTVTLRLFCNNTLDILRDGRYVVFYAIQQYSQLVRLYWIIITSSYGWTFTWVGIRTERWKIPRYVILLSAFAWATCVCSATLHSHMQG